jgi:hypothetical protein
MGLAYETSCRGCGHSFTVYQGVGMVSAAMYCETCGRGAFVEPTHRRPVCSCGGPLSPNAAPSCPACGCKDIPKRPNHITWD